MLVCKDTKLFRLCNALSAFFVSLQKTDGAPYGRHFGKSQTSLHLHSPCTVSYTHLKFLFAPDFSKVTPTTVLVALGQAFFSLSIGIGTMVTYASYVKPDTNLRHTALKDVYKRQLAKCANLAQRRTGAQGRRRGQFLIPNFPIFAHISYLCGTMSDFIVSARKYLSLIHLSRGAFVVEGRIDHSDIRGCNLLVQ